VIGFGVLFLHDEHGLSDSDAALAIAASQVFAVALRIGLGHWSDLIGSRVMPLRRAGLAVALSLVIVALLVDGPLWLLVPALVLAGGLSMSWNGLSFTATAELQVPRGAARQRLSAVRAVGPRRFRARDFAATVSNGS
jgi:MFS family permease